VESESSTKPKNEPSRRGRRGWRKRELFDLAYAKTWPWAVLFCVPLTALLTPGLTLRVEQYQFGEISPTTIRASYDFSYEDEVTTESRRSDADASVREVYNFKGAAMTDARNRISAGFDYGRTATSFDNDEGEFDEEGHAVEAASRTLDESSPARLKGMIRQIIDYIFLDGQLNECDLTLRDLEKIAQRFFRGLMGIHHQRVSYPGFDFRKQVETVVVPDR